MKSVDDVQVGERISWCGRVVRVLSIDPYRPDGRAGRRRGRYLTCEISLGVERRLHYWDNELVETEHPL